MKRITKESDDQVDIESVEGVKKVYAIFCVNAVVSIIEDTAGFETGESKYLN